MSIPSNNQRPQTGSQMISLFIFLCMILFIIWHPTADQATDPFCRKVNGDIHKAGGVLNYYFDRVGMHSESQRHVRSGQKSMQKQEQYRYEEEEQKQENDLAEYYRQRFQRRR